MLYNAVCEHGLEGIVAKKRNSLYRPGYRGWAKVKNPGYWRRESEMEHMQRGLNPVPPSCTNWVHPRDDDQPNDDAYQDHNHNSRNQVEPRRLRLPFRQQCLIVDRIMLDPVQVQLLELEIHRRSLPQLNAAHTSLFSCDSPRRLKPIRCAFYSGGVLVSAVLGTSPT
jgi:ATP dependent DNA ligase-like protein